MTELTSAKSPARNLAARALRSTENFGSHLGSRLKPQVSQPLFERQLFHEYVEILVPILKEAGFIITKELVEDINQRGYNYTYTLVTDNWIRRILLQLPNVISANPTLENKNKISVLLLSLRKKHGKWITIYVFHEDDISVSLFPFIDTYCGILEISVKLKSLRQLRELRGKVGVEAQDIVETILNLEVLPSHQAYKTVIKQIQNIEATLIKIKEVAGTIHFNQIGLLLVDILWDDASDLMNSLCENMKSLQEIEDRKQRRAELPKDAEKENKINDIISKLISKYRKELLPYYEHFIGELIYYAEKLEIDIIEARKQLEEAKRIRKNLRYAYNSTPDFVRETKEYVEALLEAITEGIKNIS